MADFRNMSKRLVFLIILVQVLMPFTLYSQGKSVFSADPAKFSQELKTYMGPNLNPVQVANLNSFAVKWDSAAFSKENMVKIVDISSQLTARQ
jgi:dipeptide/tripeptide permease